MVVTLGCFPDMDYKHVRIVSDNQEGKYSSVKLTGSDQDTTFLAGDHWVYSVFAKYVFSLKKKKRKLMQSQWRYYGGADRMRSSKAVWAWTYSAIFCQLGACAVTSWRCLAPYSNV